MNPTAQTIVTAAQLGLQLQSARKASKLSQVELANRLGISQSRMSELEREPGSISVDQLLALLNHLGLQLALQKRTEQPANRTATDW
ncbi:MAG: hypothetical protein NVS2B4_02220 [Ramlibacter sp.]